ncbi:hypothetical protein [Actinomadura rudentiformis]|uniref:Uncharacterized protein n=1 Tax=Actinomadura rudentiformis TaxID=359158 RepID=A0A6H9YVA4_9ACTN|nr:hypothetical protein [Actinomadura rudentiformis]KAB2343943.1 hypothetical protein F8566_31830 [Actinomadura rudentiformis]
MNLTDRQRKLLFVGLVVALAVVGVYLTIAAPDRDSSDSATPRTTPTTAASSGPTGPASPPPGISGAVAPSSFDIYRLLPFSQREFTTAADLAQRFVAAQGTYRFDEDPKVFTARLAALVTEQLRGEIERGATAPGILDERRSQQIVAEGTATLDRVRDIEDNSIIFLVTGKQQITKSGKQSTDSKQYAVTVARDGGSLKVYAFEPADAGQAGDTG